ncbi:MAG: SUMF1/EgtB/PvdO family nonheme iron enzyme, partial [Rhodothermales bacterium]|nr:SUMF1/EgtB/PvdO family nonheme iron enzyme [Rhodothermales bacterium]
MTLRRLLLLALFAALAAPAGQAQELVLRGGPSLLANPSDPNAETGGTSAFASLGGRFWLSDLFQFEANVAYDQRFSLEGLVHVRPFARPMPLAPYFFLGVGAQFEGEDRRGVVPVGIGLEYDVSPSTGVFFELAGRWQSRKNPQANVDELDFFVTPTVGLAYRFGTRPPFIARGDRDDFRPEEEPLLTAAEQPAEQPAEPAAESAGSAVVTPASAQFPQASYPGPASVAPVAQRPSAPPQGEPAVMGWSNNAWLIAPVEDHGDRVRVPDGTFIMGLMDEDPLRLQTANLKRVTVSSFFVDKQEVTVGKYRGYLETLDPSQRGELMPDAAAWERSGSRTTFQQYFQSGAFDDHPV